MKRKNVKILNGERLMLPLAQEISNFTYFTKVILYYLLYSKDLYFK